MNFTNRPEKLRAKLEEQKIDAIFISQPENRYYLSGFDGSAGFLLVTPGNAILATDFRYIEQAREQAPDYNIFQTSGDIANWLPGLLSEPGLRRLGFEAEHVTFSLYQHLSEIAKVKPLPKLVPLRGIVETLRAIKETEEIELTARAAKITDDSMDYIMETIQAGMTEMEVAWEIEKALRERGSQPLPFDIIVASGPNSALPHHKPSTRTINRNEPIVIDIGARIGGYCSDLTRTICLGGGDDTFKKIYDIVLGAQLTSFAIIKEGMSGGEADSLARTVIEEAGYGEDFGHGLGHGIGIAPHEMPRLGAGSADRLIPGMVFTIEPGIYLSGWGGVRIEDMAIIENGKIRMVSEAKKGVT